MAREGRPAEGDPLETGAYYQQSRKSAWLMPALAMIFTLAFIGFVVYDSYMSDSGFKRIETLEEQLEATRAELQALKEDNIRLRNEIKQMLTEPKAVEEVAREQLGFIKPGEQVYILTHTPEPPE
jgi:cell division protein FtsB